jgi:thymidylate synthase (FAD)
MVNSKTNKQAGTVKGAEELTEEHARMFQDHLRDIYREAEGLYQIALSQGVPKELARIHLPVGRYSRMRASANLRNWLAFLTLRQAPKAQWKIREYANAVHDILAEHFPRTLTLFNEKKSR